MTDDVTSAEGPKSVPGWAAKVLLKRDTSLKQAAWAYGCAKRGSEEERLLLERLWMVIAEQPPAAKVKR